MADDERRSPVEDLIDLLVYAPVGLLYEYEEVLPQLVRRGRSQVQLARVMAQMAANRGGGESVNALADAVVSMLGNRLTEIGTQIGLTPAPDGAGPGEGSEPTAAVEDDSPATDEDDPTAPLPIASYDTLTAREIVGLLDELDAAQRARIRAHEEANRARKTVLGKLDRLAV